ncbi:MAG: anthranilate phosphoribosyltransferase [Burkholderiales bacterium]|nr:anthranilate phosphoribosyltransferase [Burkholderiales bacterium]
MSLSKYIQALAKNQNLSTEEAYLATKILLGDVEPILAGQFLSLLHAKGEVADELIGFHQALIDSGKQIKVDKAFIDIVGTGGDKAGTLNISTGGSLLAAACGIPVVKHGNRAVSSSCGSADVLAELGFNLNLSDSDVHNALAKNEFAFLFAPNFYPILRKLNDVRKKLATPTIFNLMGPLLNPAGREHVILGVYQAKYVAVIAEALYRLGTTKSLVFHGNGLDELSTLNNLQAKLVTKYGIEDIDIDLKELNLSQSELSDLAGGDRMYNAQMLIKTLNGTHTGITDSLALNAGAALWVYGKANSLIDGVKIAKTRLAEGNIIKLNKLQQIVHRKYQAPQKRKSMKEALRAKGFAVISEIKRASPSAGHIADIGDPLERALEYVSYGAAAISVLTDAGFNGSMADLKRVADGLKDTPVPVLCKDFMLTPPQIAEAYANGADVILLIVHVLKEKTFEMAKIAHSFGLEVLVEVHNASELDIALAADADVIGVNQRDLNDFSMHPEQFADLIKLIPTDRVKVAESGLKTREAALNVIELGYDGVLVGEALSRLDNPATFFGK